MNIHAWNPLDTTLQFLDHFLFHQIVDTDTLLCGYKEDGFRRMEKNALNEAFGFGKGRLRLSFGELMN